MTRAVLTFHSIDDRASVLSYPVTAFARLLEDLARAAIPVLPFDELLRCDRGVTLTFDDGMRSVHENALPVLRDHGCKAHLFVTTGYLGADNRWPTQPPAAPRYEMMGWDKVERCAAQGLTIESHTRTHPDLRTLTPTQAVEECRAADADIERHIGVRPRFMAYPYGAFNAAVRSVVGPRYAACFSTRLDYLHVDAPLAAVPRLDMYYLRSAALSQRMLEPAVQRYIGLRRVLRGLRGGT
jgi:peptidoglycan/xylan/chitin deacetylase (PgdA/CDA1 family)